MVLENKYVLLLVLTEDYKVFCWIINPSTWPTILFVVKKKRVEPNSTNKKTERHQEKEIVLIASNAFTFAQQESIFETETQLECVNCTACIDECDTIMEGVGLPKGLIRYASEDEIEKNAKFKLQQE